MKREINNALGIFWLAENGPQEKLPGTINLTKHGATIRLSGTLSGREQICNGVIFGELTEKSEKLSVYNCYTTSMTKYGIEENLITTVIEGTDVLVGHHSATEHFNSLQFRIPNSSNWFKDRIFSLNTQEEGIVNISFAEFHGEYFKILKDTTISKFYTTEMTYPSAGTESLKVHKFLTYRIEETGKVEFEALWEKMLHFKRFLVFCSQANLGVTKLAVTTNEKLGEPAKKFHTSEASLRKSEKIKFGHELISYASIKDTFEKKLDTWFVLKEKSPEPFDRYFTAMEKAESDSILFFLWMATAIEELHKIRNNRKKDSFLNRLKDMIYRWEEALHLHDIESILKKIRDSRNYYAHGAGDLRDKSAHDWELLRLGYFLAGVFNMEMLSLLGYHDSEIKKIAKERFLMREYLSLTMFPGSD